MILSTIATAVTLASTITAQPARSNFVEVASYCASITDTDLCASEFPCYVDVDQTSCKSDSVATARLNYAACYSQNETICNSDARCHLEGGLCTGTGQMVLLHTEDYTAIELEGVEMVMDASYVNVNNACRAFTDSDSCLHTLDYEDLCAWEEEACVSASTAVAAMNQFSCEDRDTVSCISALNCDVAEEVCVPSSSVAIIGYGGTGGNGEGEGEGEAGYPSEFVEIASYCASITDTDLCAAEFACYLGKDLTTCKSDSVATARLNDAACYPKSDLLCDVDPRCVYDESEAVCRGGDAMVFLHTQDYTAIEQEGVEVVMDASYVNVTSACSALTDSDACLGSVVYEGLCAWEDNACVSVPTAIAEMNRFSCEDRDTAGCVSALHCRVVETNTCEPSTEVAVIGYGGSGGEGEEFFGEE